MDKVNMDKFECSKDRIIVSEWLDAANPAIDFIFSILDYKLPGIKPLKDIMTAKINSFQNKKKEEFCEIVLSDTSMITIDKVQDVSFVMEFMRTLDVINRISQNDKVIYIAKLFKSSFVLKNIDEFDIDLYEEYLHRLDYLSLKEIDLLISLYKYSNENEKKSHDEWKDFKVMVAKQISVAEDDIVSIFSGLCMTGFCREYKVNRPSKGGVEYPFFITEYFKNLVNIILD